MKNTILTSVALSTALLLPCIASASLVLDTGVPTGMGGADILNATQWSAGEFAATAGENITALSAYLTQGAGQPGDTYTLDIYSSSGFTGRSTGRSILYSAAGTFVADGWNTTAVNWTPTVSGDYWLALQVSSTTQTKGLDLPVETSTSTGTVPAIAFAYLGSGTNSEYTTAGAPAIGLQVSAASPVPLPPAIWLLLSGTLCLGVMTRRRTANLPPMIAF